MSFAPQEGVKCMYEHIHDKNALRIDRSNENTIALPLISNCKFTMVGGRSPLSNRFALQCSLFQISAISYTVCVSYFMIANQSYSAHDDYYFGFWPKLKSLRKYKKDGPPIFKKKYPSYFAIGGTRRYQCHKSGARSCQAARLQSFANDQA